MNVQCILIQLFVVVVRYWTPQDASATSSAAPDSSLSHHTDVGAIVGAVVSSVVGVILVGGALFYAIRRRRSRNSTSSLNSLLRFDAVLTHIT